VEYDRKRPYPHSHLFTDDFSDGDIAAAAPSAAKNLRMAEYQKTGKQCCGSGSGIRCLFDPWIRDPEWVYSGSRISDSGSLTHIFESLVTTFRVKSSIILLNLAQIFS
jgi:hypothetical protein